ncbi:bile acid:sodium symporter [Amylibacter kogurei]|uniref:Bile acid:sodium symporter n=1 Tax=Paramylibacter kogurei TaxID=1889778 RepID=A0A2G5K547_9RHOB|nr:bile acid:sodium symporter family protein [Amylibacter kogurei]PIB24239.1 bile acid:sodium symporter [Amylibacter kogurei]
MDILVKVFLPLSLAIIMLSLGVGLTLGDFKRVAQRKWAFAIGAVFQVLLVPLCAFVAIKIFGLTGELAAGVMLLSFCPGGSTSNIVTRLARGDVALSVSLTAVVSLLSIITVPMFIGWAVVHFMGEDVPDVSISSLAIALFLITTLPVIIGMLIRKYALDFAIRAEPILVKIASALFGVIILAALASNWTLFKENLPTLGPVLLTILIVMMFSGLAFSALAGLTWGERKTIAIEVGIQNGTLGITLAPLIVGVSAGIPALALPSAVYGILMYVVAFPFVLWIRNK